MRPWRPARVSASSRLTRSTVVKKRPRDPDRMQLRAMAMARWVLPVPVPPTRTTLRCWARKPPPARSRTRVSLIGVSLNTKSSASLARGEFSIRIACRSITSIASGSSIVTRIKFFASLALANSLCHLASVTRRGGALLSVTQRKSPSPPMEKSISAAGPARS